MHAEERQPMPETTLSRRAVFGAAAAVAIAPAAAAHTASAFPAGSAADLYQLYLAASHAFEVASSASEDEAEEWERVGHLRDATLDAPVHTRADAVAQVRLAAESIDSGALTNGKDVAALERVVRWLEAR